MKEIKSIKNSINNKQPSNIEAEQALIGSVLVNNDIIDEISTIVNSTSFFDPAHVKIYEVIESLNNKGMIANPITLKNYFEKDNMLEEVGGTEYLVKLTRFSSSAKQAVDYANANEPNSCPCWPDRRRQLEAHQGDQHTHQRSPVAACGLSYKS